MLQLNKISIGLLALCLLIYGCGGADDGASTTNVDATPDDDASAVTDGGMQVDMAEAMPTPNLALSPTSLTLPGMEGNPSEPQTVSLRNTGDAPLTVTGISTTPELEAEHFNLVDAPELPAVIAAGESLDINVTYTAPDAQEHIASLVISSDDPDAPQLTVALTGRIFANCIRTMPNSLDLGAVDPGVRSGRFEFRIINCGDIEHTLNAITLEGDEQFAWSPIGNGDAEGRTLSRGDSISIGVTYENINLAEGEVATGRLTVPFAGNSTQPVNITLRATGGAGGDRCLVRVEPSSIDFEILRVSLQRSIEVAVENRGNGPCDLRDVTVSHTRGEEQNTFTLTQTIEPQILGPMSSNVVEVTYSPQLPNPVGEQGLLSVQYFDEFLNMNRAEEVLLRGVGAEALIGSIPERLNFDLVTANTCASRQLRIGAENVGFVPLCATSYRLDGPDCDRFEFIETPEIEECLSLERGQAAAFIVQFEPNRTGEANCNVLVSSDAQNTQEVALPLVGEGSEDDSRTDSFEVGRLNPERNARWKLRLAAVGDSLRVFINDERTADFMFDEDENEVVFVPMNHPDRGDIVRVVYDAVCHDRLGLRP